MNCLSAHWRLPITAAAIVLASCGKDPVTPPAFSGDCCPCRSSPCPVIPATQRFGLYDDHFLDNFPASLDEHIAQLGATPSYSLWFIQIDDPFPGRFMRANQSRGISTVISVNIRSLALDSLRNDTLLEEIAAGKWDQVFGDFADSARSLGGTVYYRLGYEMNGNWFPWGCKPADFVAAWQRVHEVFAQRGATNVQWIFSPNALWADRQFGADILKYYPGDSLVDIVGLDGYNYGDGYDKYHRWTSFSEVFARSLVECLALNKPLWITEAGCPSDSRRPQWLSDALNYIDRNACIETFIWFNAHKAMSSDFRLESDSASLAVVKDWLAR